MNIYFRSKILYLCSNANRWLMVSRRPPFLPGNDIDKDMVVASKKSELVKHIRANPELFYYIEVNNEDTVRFISTKDVMKETPTRFFDTATLRRTHAMGWIRGNEESFNEIVKWCRENNQVFKEEKTVRYIFTSDGISRQDVIEIINPDPRDPTYLDECFIIRTGIEHSELDQVISRECKGQMRANGSCFKMSMENGERRVDLVDVRKGISYRIDEKEMMKISCIIFNFNLSADELIEEEKSGRLQMMLDKKEEVFADEDDEEFGEDFDKWED
ncbi:hypothetical protein GGF37_000831 [Kickxella alabastrina]|nr:hypothetical protein GGF37_000831 [Kickxella alabastrina]